MTENTSLNVLNSEVILNWMGSKRIIVGFCRQQRYCLEALNMLYDLGEPVKKYPYFATKDQIVYPAFPGMKFVQPEGSFRTKLDAYTMMGMFLNGIFQVINKLPEVKNSFNSELCSMKRGLKNANQDSVIIHFGPANDSVRVVEEIELNNKGNF